MSIFLSTIFPKADVLWASCLQVASHISPLIYLRISSLGCDLLTNASSDFWAPIYAGCYNFFLGFLLLQLLLCAFYTSMLLYHNIKPDFPRSWLLNQNLQYTLTQCFDFPAAASRGDKMDSNSQRTRWSFKDIFPLSSSPSPDLEDESSSLPTQPSSQPYKARCISPLQPHRQQPQTAH